MNIKKKQFILYLSLFIFLLIINYFLPYTNDDWAWGSSIGVDRLNNFFSNYNGRYLGNFLVILLTRSKLLKAIVISLTFTLIAYFINKITDINNYIISLICVILTVFIPMPIFRQVVSWTSGFANYVPPTLFILIFVFLNRNLFSDKEVDISNKYCTILFLLGFVTVLFMEHLTIYCVILSAFTIVYCYFKKLKINLGQFLYFIGALLGSILMFSNGAYRNIMNGTDFYRKLPKNNFIIKIAGRYFATIYENLILNNIVILFIIALCFSILYFKKIKNNKNIKFRNKLYASLIVIISYTIYAIISNLLINYDSFPLVLRFIEGIFTIFYFIAVILFLLFMPSKFISKNKLLFYLVSIIVMTLPLFIVSPVTPRCFFPMYIFECLFCLQLIIEVFKYIDFMKYYNYLKLLLHVIFIILIGCYIWISFSIFWVSNKMIKSINTQKILNNEEFILPKLPYEQFMKHPNPTDKENIRRFKLFYKIPNNQKIKFIDYKLWHDIMKEK